MLDKGKFLRMQLHHHAGSKTLSGNLSLSSEVFQVFTFCYHTYTHTPQVPVLVRQPLTHPEGSGQRRRLRREMGRLGFLKKKNQIREVADISHIS